MSDPTQSPYSGADSQGGSAPYFSGQSQPGWQAPTSPVPGAALNGSGAYPGQPVPPGGQPMAPGGAPAGQGGAWGETATPSWANGAGIAPGAGVSWAPAQQPGIIPLRPLVLGELFEGSFRSIRANPTVMFGFAVGVMAILAILNTAYTIFSTTYLLGLTPQGSIDNNLDEMAAGMTRFVVGQLAGSLILSVGQTIVTGMLSVAVSDAVLGRVSSVGDVWHRIKGRIGALLVNTLIIGLILSVWSVIVIFIFGLLLVMIVGGIGASSGGEPGPLVAVVFLLGFILIFTGVVAIFALYVKFLFAPTSVVLERTGPIKSIGRSWALTNQGYGRVFGRLLLMLLVSMVIGAVLGLVSGIIGGVFTVVVPVISVGLTSFLSAIVSGLVLPLTASMTTLMFIDERMRKEGLATQLAQAASQ